MIENSLKNSLLKTPLYDLHQELGGKMVEFAGYSMPVHYKAGILNEHLHTRDKAGLFDVSHMGQITFSSLKGMQDAAKILESFMTIDISSLQPFQQRYGLLTNDQGGIIDDTMVIHAEDHYLIVVNAANKKNDFDYLSQKLPDHCKIELRQDQAMLAFQGPMAAKILTRFVTVDLTNFVFMSARPLQIAHIPCWVSRSGYTGEDGFEIFVPNDQAVILARQFLHHPEVLPVGLGARDSLRLEAGLCLHGQDIDQTTTPIEAGLLWAVSKNRRDQGGFPGFAIIKNQIVQGPPKRLVALVIEGRMPARAHALIQNKQGDIVGEVTSGGFAPSLNYPICMGYVHHSYKEIDTELEIQVRDKTLKAKVTKLPFVPHRYYRGLN
ncbi:MAG: glycine cleavage system aminomethyltransferase GcvT [Alphaproteobacteria bacterium]|nr:glycine cleavage system aminomethyltransferase GcvT [Alphaproteobacteria bacterium]